MNPFEPATKLLRPITSEESGSDNWGMHPKISGKPHHKYFHGKHFLLFRTTRIRRCLQCRDDVSGYRHGSIFCESCAKDRIKNRPKTKPKQAAAHQIVSTAVNAGILPRLDGTITCVECGAVAKHYEHRDYLKPLEVDPVCLSCNFRRGPAANAA